MSTPTTPLAELAAAVRRLERLRVDCPEPYRPTRALVFATVDAAKADVIKADRPEQAMAIVADWEREAGTLITSKLVHAPLVPGGAR